MSKATVQYVMQKWNIRPDTEQGQHFLVDDTILQRIITASQLNKKQHVLEVGPGIGTLTSLLAETAERVAAVEIDPQFKPLLEAFVAVNTNVQLLFADILKVPFETVRAALDLRSGSGYKVIANIPYYLTSRFFATVLKYQELPTMIVVLIQKEVAERIVAQPGDHSKLSLSIQLYGAPRIAFQVPRTAFSPIPEVDSAVLVIEDIHQWSYAVPERKVWQLITFGFSSRRKKLVNNLMAGMHISRDAALDILKKAGIEPNIRAEDMSIESWLRLAEHA